MSMRKPLIILGIGLYLTGCSSEQSSQTPAVESAMYDVSAEPPGIAAAPKAANPATPIIAAAPQIAYEYSYGFRLPTEALAKVQAKHVALCDSLGVARCRVIDMKRSAGEGDYASGSLQLAVASSIARPFGARLSEAAGEEGGTLADSGITAEDLSKQIVDTEARLRQRTLLATRLTELLATRKGSVAELVEAERAVAQVQEEIDQARSWLAQMRGRVAMSKISVSYSSASPAGGGFAEPIREVLGRASAILGISVAALITLVVGLGPWVALIALGWWLWRRRRRRLAALREADSAPPA
jgi:hypothetical protein